MNLSFSGPNLIIFRFSPIYYLIILTGWNKIKITNLNQLNHFFIMTERGSSHDQGSENELAASSKIESLVGEGKIEEAAITADMLPITDEAFGTLIRGALDKFGKNPSHNQETQKEPANISMVKSLFEAGEIEEALILANGLDITDEAFGTMIRGELDRFKDEE